jgi:hypothetical protein
MRAKRPGSLGDIEKFFEYARHRDERPALKPLKYTFDTARQPDMILPERPRAEVHAADAALREIKAVAGQARQLYKERRRDERPHEARAYVRHQLALGMLDAPGRFAEAERQMDVVRQTAPVRETRSRAMFGYLRRRGKG